MKSRYQDLYHRDQLRIANWPPTFRGEGPFLPTGRRRPARRRYAVIVVAMLALSVVGAQWRFGPFAVDGSALLPAARQMDPAGKSPSPTDSLQPGMASGAVR